MMKLLLFMFVSAFYTTIKSEDSNPNITVTYLPKWEDLDKRPLPQWYDSAKIGIFIHWGVYSVPSTYAGSKAGSEWFWHDWRLRGSKKLDLFMKNNYRKSFKYTDFAPMFTAELFDPEEWAQLFAKAGARYVVLTSKHHDGFTLFPTERRNWNSVDVGPKKDIVQVLSKSVREYGMKFGVYYSLLEWFNKYYIHDKQSNGLTTTYIDQIMWPDIKFLINAYKPSVLWSDGDWDFNDSYWNGSKILALLYNESPVKDEIVVNDRWSHTSRGAHGDFYTYHDNFNSRSLMPHKWENCFSIDKKSWGYRVPMKHEEIMDISEMLEEVISTVSCGGNVLINVGPTKNGTIPAEFKKVLLRLGKWLKTNGEAIYDTSPWVEQRDSFDSDVWYTCKRTKYNPLSPTEKPADDDSVTTIYVIFLAWPRDNVLKIQYLTSHLINAEFLIYMIQPANKDEANCYVGDNSTNIDGTAKTPVKNCLIRVTHRISNDLVEVSLPKKYGKYAWVLKVVFLNGGRKESYANKAEPYMNKLFY